MPFLRSHKIRIDEILLTNRLADIPGWPYISMDWANATEDRLAVDNYNPDLNHVNDKSNEGKTLLHIAVSKGEVGKVLKLLRVGARTEDIDPDGKTALHIACWHPANTVDMAKIMVLLMVFGANVDTCDPAGRTAYQLLRASNFSKGWIQYNYFATVRAEMESLVQIP